VAGEIALPGIGIAALRGFCGVQVKAEFPDSDLPKIVQTVLLAAVLNTPTLGGGLRLAPAAQVDDGALELVMIEMSPKREILTWFPRLLFLGELKTKTGCARSCRKNYAQHSARDVVSGRR